MIVELNRLILNCLCFSDIQSLELPVPVPHSFAWLQDSLNRHGADGFEGDSSNSIFSEPELEIGAANPVAYSNQARAAIGAMIFESNEHFFNAFELAT